MGDDAGYVAEIGISMVCTPFAFFRQSNQAFDEVAKVARLQQASPHLYIVGQRPRVTLDPASVVVTRQAISGRFLFATPGGLKPYEWSTGNPLDDGALELECPYPHATFALRSKDGRIVGGECALLLPTVHSCTEVPAEHDLKVVYVGQAFGEEGDRNAVDRLRSHGTLQGIYADAMQRAPHMDVWLLLLHAEATEILTLFPSDLNPAVLLEESLLGKAKQLLEGPVSLQQRINFTEAALIRYFVPQYNVQYRDRFPHPSHKSYSECYAADVNAVSAELQTRGTVMRTFSDAVKPAYEHIASYALHSPEERRHMFEFVEGFPIPHGPVSGA